MKKQSSFLKYLLTALLSSFVTLVTVVALLNFLPNSMGLPVENYKLAELEQLISDCFIGEVDQVDLEDAAAEAMVSATGDRWSYYIPASDYQSYLEQMSNAYVGVGITIQVQEAEEGFLITEVVPDGPADLAGIRAGDILMGIDGTSCVGMDTNKAASLVRAEEGTDVTLTVLRGEEELSVTATRRRFDVPVASCQLLDSGYGLIHIENFDEKCYTETRAAIDEMLSQGAKGLIFDVRFNPGGYQTELVKVLDDLLPEGILFQSEDYLGRKDTDYSDADCLEIPMAVLVNEDSYSAAEFFAAALQEYEAGIVVGTQTCGKGYFQTAFNLSDGSAVSLSIGRYFTPKGLSLADVGVTPDVYVDVDDDAYWAIYTGALDVNEDPQILAAVEALNSRN